MVEIEQYIERKREIIFFQMEDEIKEKKKDISFLSVDKILKRGEWNDNTE